MRRIIGIVLLAMLLVQTPTLAQRPVGLHVQGVSLVDATGARFVISGINVEAFRDYDNGCGWVTDGMYTVREGMADTLKSWNVNMVRLNYSYRFLNTANLSKYLDFAQALANRGIYVMPSDHSYTGNALVNAAASYPTMKAIIDGMRARGIGDYLVVGTPNEPGPNVTPAAWIAAMKNYLVFLRTQNAYDGVVVMDGWGWATMLDVATFKQVQAIDAGLRANGQANLVLSNHIYPNIQGLPAQIWNTANQIPLLIGEVGIINPGSSPVDMKYVKDTISGYLNAGMANGHNGILFWLMSFCDENKMVEDWVNPAVPYTLPFKLSSYGQAVVSGYYAKLPTSNIPPPPQSTPVVSQPTASPSRTPTHTVIATNTPRPTQTRTAQPTSQPTAQCDAVIESSVTFNGRPARMTSCIKLQ